MMMTTTTERNPISRRSSPPGFCAGTAGRLILRSSLLPGLLLREEEKEDAEDAKAEE